MNWVSNKPTLSIFDFEFCFKNAKKKVKDSQRSAIGCATFNDTWMSERMVWIINWRFYRIYLAHEKFDSRERKKAENANCYRIEEETDSKGKKSHANWYSIYFAFTHFFLHFFRLCCRSTTQYFPSSQFERRPTMAMAAATAAVTFIDCQPAAGKLSFLNFRHPKRHAMKNMMEFSLIFRATIFDFIVSRQFQFCAQKTKTKSKPQ